MSHALYFFLKYGSEIRKIEKVDSHSSHSQPPAPNSLIPLTPRTDFYELLVHLSSSSMQIRALWIYIYIFFFPPQKPTYCTRCSASFFFSLISVSWRILYRLKEFLQPFLQPQNIPSCGYLKIYLNSPCWLTLGFFPIFRHYIECCKDDFPRMWVGESTSLWFWQIFPNRSPWELYQHVLCVNIPLSPQPHHDCVSAKLMDKNGTQEEFCIELFLL